MLTKLKHKVQQALASEAKMAYRIGLTPNRISVMGIILALFSAMAYAEWQINELYPFLAVALLLLSGFCDALDGVVARLHQQTTVLGGFMDSLLDRYADAVVYIGIIMGGLCDIIWGLATLVGSMLVSYSRARAEAVGVNMESIGIAERAERIIILTAASLAAIFWSAHIVINAGMILLAALTNLTVLQRSLHVYRKLQKKEAARN